MPRIMSTGEERLYKLYRAYARSISNPEAAGVRVFNDENGTHILAQRGGSLAVYSAKGTRFGMPGPSTSLHGFHVMGNAASPITTIQVEQTPVSSIPRSQAKIAATARA